jgi:Flp pilus assembly protein TadD
MARPLINALCLAVLVAGCATASQQASRAPTAHERLRLAAIAETNNNVEVALSIYRNAALAEPENVEVQLRYASALARQGAHREAALVLEQALARRPRDRVLLLALGRTQLRANDLRAAAQSFDCVREQAPGDPDALNGLGVIADFSGDHRLAQRRYREGLTRAPQHEGLRNNLALSLALSGAAVDAIGLLQALRQDGNMDVRVRHNLAFVHAMAGDHTTARQLAGAELDPVEQQYLVSAAALLAAASRPTSPPTPPSAPAGPTEPASTAPAPRTDPPLCRRARGDGGGRDAAAARRGRRGPARRAPRPGRAALRNPDRRALPSAARARRRQPNAAAAPRARAASAARRSTGLRRSPAPAA